MSGASPRALAVTLVACGAAGLSSCDGRWAEPSPGRAAAYDPAPATCGECHPRHLAEWSTSGHARSAVTPAFQAFLPEVEAGWGAEARAACEGCHAGAAGVEPTPQIGCVTCHAATGNRGTRDGRLTVRAGAPLAGPGRALDAPHPTRDGAFLRAPDLCGTCHEVTGPNLFIEPTLTEFRASPAAAAGLTCQSCHAPKVAGGHTDHRFRGFGADELLASALRLELTPLPAGGARVTLTNVGAGHAVPTGARLMRALWVEVDAHDGAPPQRVITLGADLRDADGAPVALPTDATSATVTALDPGASLAADVARHQAAGAPLTATLYARALEGGMAAALGLEDAVPARVIATATLP